MEAYFTISVFCLYNYLFSLISEGPEEIERPTINMDNYCWGWETEEFTLFDMGFLNRKSWR